MTAKRGALQGPIATWFVALAATLLVAGLAGNASAQSWSDFDPRRLFGSPEPRTPDPVASEPAARAPDGVDPRERERRAVPRLGADLLPGPVPEQDAGVALASLAGGTPRITWEVENGFRFFTDPQDTALHRQVFQSLPPQARREPVLASEQVLSRQFPAGWAAGLKGTTCWDPVRHLHRCPDGGDYVNPASHAVVAKLDSLPDAGTVRCVWTVTPVGVPKRGGDVGARTETLGCEETFRAQVPYPSGAELSVAIGGREIARQAVRVEDLLVVGVGDSFGSGEGNPDVPVRFDRSRGADYGLVAKGLAIAGYPARVGGWRSIGDDLFERENARWLDQACHRSLYSHQLRAALHLAVEKPHRSVTFLHLACSGAEVTKGLFLRYKGHEWVPDPPELSQISAIAQAQCGERQTRVQELPEAYHMRGKVPDLQGLLTLHECDRRRSRKIDLMLVSIGGNDVGFARLVANAVLQEDSLLRRIGGWFGQVHNGNAAVQQMEELSERYRAFKRALHYILHIPWEESDRVIMTAYPALALLDRDGTTCPSGRAGMEVLPMFSLSQKEAIDSQQAADRLDAIMREAARKHGWSFAQAHRDKFIGHGICAGYDGVSLSSADDLRFPRLINGRWDPYNPADYKPYASRQRWFRTPNDAYLTGHFHVAGKLLDKVLRNQGLTWTQVLLASTYSGAFHPTAEGHAAIADSVVDVANAVLEKYAGGNRAK